jgi:hypothetical protein
VENCGQVADDSVRFYADIFAGRVFVQDNGDITYAISHPDRGWVLREHCVGLEPETMRGEDISSAQISEFRGRDPEQWRSNLKVYNRIALGAVADGISLELIAHGRSVEKIFTVQPGADPGRIALSMAGGDGLKVSGDRSLLVSTDHGDVRFSPPVAYQICGSRLDYVDVSYRVKGNTYGFALGSYDRSRPLIIDPLLAATFLGGAEYDSIYALAVSPSGTVYVAGQTTSAAFPRTAGAYDTNDFGSAGDVYIARFDAGL